MDWLAIWLSIKLAAVVSVALLFIGLPIASWLAFSRHRWKFAVERSWRFRWCCRRRCWGFTCSWPSDREPDCRPWYDWTGHGLAFTFEGLVVASTLYSLPFAVQPIAAAFDQIDRTLLEAAATLGASRWRVFHSILLPGAFHGILAAAVLSFAHTLGEFGVVLMVGGNLPGVTRTVSISIYDSVQAFDQATAAGTALLLVGVSFVTLVIVYGVLRRPLAVAGVHEPVR